MIRLGNRLPLAAGLLFLPGCGDKHDPIDVYDDLVVETQSLPDGVEAVPYSALLEASGGDSNYTWSVTTGSLPAGLGLLTSPAQIAGMPSAVGSSTFTVEVRSGDGQTAVQSLTVVVSERLTLQPTDFCSAHPAYSIATVEDANLEAAVRGALGMGMQDDLTCGMLSGLTSLTAENLGVISLWGLQNLTGLTILRLDGNPSLNDIEPLLHNTGLGSGDVVELEGTNVPCDDVAALRVKGAAVTSDCVSRIAFASDRDGNREIYVMDDDGSDQLRLTNNGRVDTSPAWSRDGSKIAFASGLPTAPSEIYVMGADGSNPVPLTNNAVSDLAPAWSPDGSKIAFSSERDGNSEIYVMGADGSNPTNLTNNPGDDFGPKWSPDGSKIVFYSLRDGNREIYVMNANGSNQLNLTSNPALDLRPAWSPGGSRIAFQSDRDGNSEIYLMDTSGSNVVRLTNNAANDSFPAWSPDGSQLVFDSNRDGIGDIYMMYADGTGVGRLTNNAAFDFTPAWALRR